jgi:hypothetical protein
MSFEPFDFLRVRERVDEVVPRELRFLPAAPFERLERLLDVPDLSAPPRIDLAAAVI